MYSNENIFNTTHQGDVYIKHEFIKTLKNLRILIVYSNDFYSKCALFYYILPSIVTEEGNRLYNIIYSESATKTLKNVYNSLRILKPELAEILDMSYIIKVGRNTKIPFGRLYDFVQINTLSEINSNFDRLIKILEEIEDIILFHGFSILLTSTNTRRTDIEFLDYISDNATFITECNKFVYTDILTLFFDIVLLAREDDITFSNHNILEVLHSNVLNIIPGFSIRYEILPHE